ncbi:RNA-binding S4 domain-containing protein [Ralstonia syzygii subsp. celebesensis]|uniref:RNA-binding protein n=2 Tax=Ralstonia syzygii subsp. celebesensis TaxID=1310168 RepID=A0A1U9VFC4_9RALS|nr:RNA-binding S4 domain-containing protein [Ralstonia syzygii]AQW29379.1 RNA-binding protein [blood disease bacterium A2-HR MARDI]QQV56748.1 RNA-binding S4 domain-containing protein [Ralstonia syzygii subsp. celebesensis]CCA79725.1 ribosome-associated heat shock protein 15 [blood disease bacterium R229]
MTVSTDADGRVRIDKWLWAARFFKTRSQATDAVERGRVQLNDQPVRPAKDVKIGDRVRVAAHEQQWEVDVLALAEVRGPASVAQTLYAETEASRLKRTGEAERRRLYREPATQIAGRPTKRDRRRIDKLGG